MGESIESAIFLVETFISYRVLGRGVIGQF
jgi:hypothetical protein